MERQFTEQELVRREKAERLRELGLDPFGDAFERTAFAGDLKEKYKDVEHEAFDTMDDVATVAGRIMFIRKMGKASFFTIKDKTGPIQIYISINDIGEDSYNLFKTADIGDIVGVHGKIMKTKTGELVTGLQDFLEAMQASNGKFDGTINDLYKYKYLTKSQAEQAKKAM